MANPFQFNPRLNNIQQPPMQNPQPQFYDPQGMFPQPQGNVYTINSTLEVANVPAGAGMSVALCINEGLMYIKSMQNGAPLFWAYRLVPYVEEEKKSDPDFEERLRAIEEKYETIMKELRT